MRATRELCSRRKTYVAALLAALSGALPTDVCGRVTGAIEKSEKSDFRLCGRQGSYIQEGKPT
jgi:hypothetical protein